MLKLVKLNSDGNVVEIIELENQENVPEGYVEIDDKIQLKIDEMSSEDSLETHYNVYKIVKIDKDYNILKILNFEGSIHPKGYHPVIEDVENLDKYLEPKYSHENKTIVENAKESKIIKELKKDESKLKSTFLNMKKIKKSKISSKIDDYVSGNIGSMWELIAKASSVEDWQNSEDVLELKRIKDKKLEILQKIDDCKSFKELEDIEFVSSFFDITDSEE